MSQDKIRDQLINELESLGRFIGEGSPATGLLPEEEGAMGKSAQANIDIHNNQVKVVVLENAISQLNDELGTVQSYTEWFEELKILSNFW